MCMVLYIPMALLLVLGWLIRVKKMTGLISGYNTATPTEKKRYDTEKLCRYFGNFLFILAGLLFLTATASVLWQVYADTIIMVGLGLLAVAILGGIVFLNTGNRIRS